MTLREHRIAADLQQRDIADMLGVTVQQVSYIERGQRRLQQRHLDILAWRYGWQLEAQQPPPEAERRRVRSVRRQSLPAVSITAQAELVALLALAARKAYGGEVPQDWRNRWRYRELWTAAVRAGARQLMRGRVA